MTRVWTGFLTLSSLRNFIVSILQLVVVMSFFWWLSRLMMRLMREEGKWRKKKNLRVFIVESLQCAVAGCVRREKKGGKKRKTRKLNHSNCKPLHICKQKNHHPIKRAAHATISSHPSLFIFHFLFNLGIKESIDFLFLPTQAVTRRSHDRLWRKSAAAWLTNGHRDCAEESIGIE